MCLPDPKHTSTFEFCENGAKAVAWEAMAKRCTPAFFAAHTLEVLSGKSDYELAMEGRLTHPMAYDPASDKYLPVSWEDALDRIGAILRSLETPDQAEFYTSGRASNEAAFLYQVFVREFGTNNFPRLLQYVPSGGPCISLPKLARPYGGRHRSLQTDHRGWATVP
jgi:anaerobic selenocysteine-containing dehydrogenase